MEIGIGVGMKKSVEKNNGLVQVPYENSVHVVHLRSGGGNCFDADPAPSIELQ